MDTERTPPGGIFPKSNRYLQRNNRSTWEKGGYFFCMMSR
ncbi:hypothetical protein HMPREF1147_1263 [Selenomonas sp. FOBRC9]|nr:hypothetical protein HMPREF1147_1263 [Selenomonas sp. FOBRC9]